jgi:hypothetical protein
MFICDAISLRITSMPQFTPVSYAHHHAKRPLQLNLSYNSSIDATIHLYLLPSSIFDFKHLTKRPLKFARES